MVGCQWDEWIGVGGLRRGFGKLTRYLAARAWFERQLPASPGGSTDTMCVIRLIGEIALPDPPLC